MRGSLAAVGLLSLLLALPAPARAAPQDGDPRRERREFSDRISVMAIEIPVRVLVDGRPVAGLTAANFQVFEGGREHPIVGFEQVDLTAPAAAGTVETPSALAGEGRRLLLLFDTANSGRTQLARAVDGARGLIDGALHPADRVAVATYSAVHGIAFVTGFVTDRLTTRLALEVVRAGVGGERKAHAAAARALAERDGTPAAVTPLERFRHLTDRFGRAAAIAVEEADADLGLATASATFGAAGGFAAAAGPRFGFAAPVRDPVRRSYQNLAPGDIASGLARGPGRSGVRALSLELIEMATVLRDLPGQKHLFLLSQGFSSTLLEDATALDHLENALEALRRANWAIQAIDIGGAGFDAHALFFLAHETGGELIENHGNLGKAAAKLVERTAVSYVLTIQPTDVPVDDRYRRLQVKLRDGPRRARLIHRPGYYTPKPPARRNHLENTLDAASLLLSGREASDLAVEVLALPLAGPGLVEVPVVVEVAAAELAAAAGRGALLEFHGCALDRRGEIQDLFSQRVRLSRRELNDLVAGGGIRFFDRLAVPAGEYTLRLLVRDLGTGAIFLRGLPLAVGGAPASPQVVGPLVVPDDGWAVLRGEGSLNGGRGVDHPFVLGGRPRIPSPRPALRRGDSAVFFLKTPRLDGADLRVRARILDPAGRPVEGGELAFRERVLGEEDRVEALLGTLAAAGLAPGPYRLEVTAWWNGGGRSVGVGEFRVVAD